MNVKQVILEMDVARTRHDYQSLIHVLQSLLLAVVDDDRLLEQLYCHVAKLLACHDLVTKRLVCVLLKRWHKLAAPEVTLVAYNTLRLNLADPNPLVRCLALKTMLHCFPCVEDTKEALKDGLEDESAHVRRAAVFCCVQLHYKTTESANYVDLLYAMLRDPDPLVVCNCIAALEEILRAEGGIVINHKIVDHIVSRLPQFTDWGMLQVMQVLRKYIPTSQKEMFHLMNALDPFLKSPNSAVVVETTKLFLQMVKNENHLPGFVIKCVSPHLVFHLNDRQNPEAMHLVLEFVKEYSRFFIGSFSVLSKGLFCYPGDPIHIKSHKIEILQLLASEETLEIVLEELSAYCTDHEESVVCLAVRAIGVMAQTHKTKFTPCIEMLLQFLSMNVESTTWEILNVFRDLELDGFEKKDLLVTNLQGVPQTLSTVTAKCAYLNFLGIHGCILPESPYILEDLVDELISIDDETVRESLLLAIVKLFFARPSEVQPTLGRFLELSLRDCGEGNFKERTQLYFRLLKGNIDVAKSVILGDSRCILG